MAESKPKPTGEIVNSQRIGDALDALTDPTRDPTDPAFGLSQHELATIQDTLTDSQHPLAGFASYLIDQWDQTDPNDRVAGLLLFREINRSEPRRQTRNRVRSTGDGITHLPSDNVAPFSKPFLGAFRTAGQTAEVFIRNIVLPRFKENRVDDDR